MPIKLGSFNVVIGMDWLSKYHAKSICDEKVVHIPIDGETLIIQGDRTQVMEQKSEDKRLKNIPVVREFSDVFPDDLPGLPSVRQEEFQIDLIPRVEPVAPQVMEQKSEDKRLKNIPVVREFSDVFPDDLPGLPSVRQEEFQIDSPAIIRDFSKIAKYLTELTQKNKKYIWGEDQETAFQLLKQKLCKALILALPKGNDDFVVYCDASHQEYVGKCLTCFRVKAKCQKPSSLVVQLEIPMWKWERITIDFVSKLPKTSNGHDTIWVIVNRLTKSTHFIPTRVTDSMETPTRLYIKEIISRHGVPISVILDHDSHFTSIFWQSLQNALGTQLNMSTAYHPETDGQSERTIQTLKDMLRACVIDFRKGWEKHLPLVDFSYNNSYHASIKAAPFEELYGRKCRSPICWAEIGDVQHTGPKIIHETTEKIVQIRQCLQAKCLSNESLVILMKELRLDDKLNFVEELVEVMDREVKQLKQSLISIVKVRWNSKRGPKFTWEREDPIRAKENRNEKAWIGRLDQSLYDQVPNRSGLLGLTNPVFVSQIGKRKLIYTRAEAGWGGYKQRKVSRLRLQLCRYHGGAAWLRLLTSSGLTPAKIVKKQNGTTEGGLLICEAVGVSNTAHAFGFTYSNVNPTSSHGDQHDIGGSSLSCDTRNLQCQLNLGILHSPIEASGQNIRSRPQRGQTQNTLHPATLQASLGSQSLSKIRPQAPSSFTLKENGVTRPKKYSELSTTEAIQADCDVKATNIILQGLLPEVHLMHERNSDLLALVATHQTTQSPNQTHQNSYQNTQFQPQVSSYQSSQYGSPYQSQQYSHNQSSTPLSITYPPNDFQSSVHHNVYSLSSSIPQVEYALSVNQ
nr:reverse transcriptase domain-containing protein [Tanacetum cinerariifolium]